MRICGRNSAKGAAREGLVLCERPFMKFTLELWTYGSTHSFSGTGARRIPSYCLVVADSRLPGGRFTRSGTYDVMKDPAEFS
jgi:hypothetical protein